MELVTKPEDGEVVIDIVQVVAGVLKNLTHSHLLREIMMRSLGTRLQLTKSSLTIHGGAIFSAVCG